MKNILLSMIMLTALDGNPIWVESTQVQIIRHHSVECGEGTAAVIRVGSTALCVKETPDEIREKIREADR